MRGEAGMGFTELLAILKDVVLTIGGGVGIYVALRGLSTWRRQLRGNIDFDVSRRLLHGAYRIREGIRVVRAPLIPVEEMVHGMQEAGLSAEQITQETNLNAMKRYAYATRWKRVSEAVVDFNVVAMEAEAVWGRDVATRAAELLKCVRELSVNINMWLDESESTVEQPDRDEFTIRMRNYRKIVIAQGEEADEFWQRIQAAISRIEEFVKPHLKN